MYLRHQTYTLYYRDVCILVFLHVLAYFMLLRCMLKFKRLVCGSDDVTQYKIQFDFFFFFMCTATRFSLNTVQWSKCDFAAHFFNDFWLLTSRIFTRFRIFSIVFPKTLLFMSLKKSFSNSFCALERRFVFNSMCGFNHAFSLNAIH